MGNKKNLKIFEYLTLIIDRKVQPWKEKTLDDRYNVVGKWLVSWEEKPNTFGEC